MASDGTGGSTGRYWKGFTGCQILEPGSEPSQCFNWQRALGNMQMNEMHQKLKWVLMIWSDGCLGLK